MLICGIVTFIIFLDFVEINAGQLAPGQYREELPTDFQSSLDGAILGETLVNKFTFEGAPELEIFLVYFAQLFLTNNGCQCTHILSPGVCGIELRTPTWMVIARASLANTIFHQTGKAWQYCNRRIYTCEVKFTP